MFSNTSQLVPKSSKMVLDLCSYAQMCTSVRLCAIWAPTPCWSVSLRAVFETIGNVTQIIAMSSRSPQHLPKIFPKRPNPTHPKVNHHSPNVSPRHTEVPPRHPKVPARHPKRSWVSPGSTQHGADPGLTQPWLSLFALQGGAASGHTIPASHVRRVPRREKQHIQACSAFHALRIAKNEAKSNQRSCSRTRPVHIFMFSVLGLSYTSTPKMVTRIGLREFQRAQNGPP